MNCYPKLLKRKLFSLINNMSLSSDKFSNSPGQDFSRSRKLDFSTCIKFILGMNGNTLKKELHDFTNYDSNTVTPSALCQQRAKFKDDTFQHLFNQFTSAATGKKHYKGYRLLAVDGSALNIFHDPNNPDTYVRHTCNQKGYNALHLNALYDLQNRTYVDALIQPEKRMDEYRALCDLVDRSPIKEPTIIIGDRGYESYNVIAHIAEKGYKYLIRGKDITSNGIAKMLDLPDSDEFDVTVNLQLTYSSAKKVKAILPNHHTISKKSTFDFLKDSNDFYTMSFRVLRFKVSDGTYRLLITNLWQNEFDFAEINFLYGLRWGIETSFRELKYAIGLTTFHSKKVPFIIQEIYARLIMYNFCESIISRIIIKKSNTKHDYQVNFTAAIDICKQFFVVKKGKRPPDVEALIQKNTLPIRKDRKFPRFVRRGRSVSFNYRVA